MFALPDQFNRATFKKYYIGVYTSGIVSQHSQ
jgi:hypothetical protein